MVRKLLISGCLLALVLTGCASSGDEPGQPSSASEAKAAGQPPEKLSLIDIESELGGDVKIVRIIASAGFEYIAYALADPYRLAVEIEGMANQLAEPFYLVEDSLVKRIGIIDFDKADKLRVEILLKSQTRYDLALDGGQLTVTLSPPAVDKDKEALAEKLIETQARLRSLAEQNEVLERVIADMEKRLAEAEKPRYSELDIAEVKESIERRIESWLAAWRSKNLDEYGKFYADTFKNRGKGRKAWLKSKRAKFKRAREIFIETKDMSIEADAARAIVEFIQMYRAGGYEDIGVKTMALIKTGEGWKIESEKWKPLKSSG